MTVHVYSQFGWDLDALTKAMEPLKQSFQDIADALQYAMMNTCVGLTQKEREMGDPSRIWNAKTDGVRSVYVDHIQQQHLVLRNDLPQTLICAPRQATDFRYELGLRPHTMCYRPHTPLTWVYCSMLAGLGLYVAMQYSHACTGVPGKHAPHVWTSWYAKTVGGPCRWCRGDSVGDGCTSEQMHVTAARASTPEDWRQIVGSVVEISRGVVNADGTVFYPEKQLGLCVGPRLVRFLRRNRLGEAVQLPMNAYIQHDGVDMTGWRCRYWLREGANMHAPEVADVQLALSLEESERRAADWCGWDPYPLGSI